ncbi:MAG: ABC transporter ATP-binding protein [Fuerstiella sp.]|nr:ABC transporter ATP-binding protein [Fuerstiella sp.]
MSESSSDIPLIQFESVTKLYGKVLGVNDISLSLSQGAYGLLGPNGAGKSTLLNLITGQLVPTRGNVLVFGQSPRNNPQLMSRIGFCPGFEGLYSSITGLNWVTFLLEMHGVPRRPARNRAAECMAITGMLEAMNRPVASYSRGMRQRTKIAQAIAHDPQLLILDEPLSGLDPVGRSDMTEVIKKRIADGASVILASHVLHEIEAVTDSFLLISGGRLLASGTTDEVHKLLFDLPVEIQIRCDRPHRLSSLIMEHRMADTVSIGHSPCGAEILRVATRQTAEFSALLPKWIAEYELQVDEMKTADDSLQTLFNSLMKIHRGEL